MNANVPPNHKQEPNKNKTKNMHKKKEKTTQVVVQFYSVY